jgi:hypothetical protein
MEFEVYETASRDVQWSVRSWWQSCAWDLRESVVCEQVDLKSQGLDKHAYEMGVIKKRRPKCLRVESRAFQSLEVGKMREKQRKLRRVWQRSDVLRKLESDIGKLRRECSKRRE